jgi:crotonobetainyl-CoA:carnitine CoA-transferase CaiB-like acyl-CoA transferase
MDSQDVSPAHRCYRCSDGWLLLACRDEAHWRELAKALGRPELAYTGSWQTVVELPPQGPMGALLESIFAGEPLAVWLKRLEAHGVPCSEA